MKRDVAFLFSVDVQEGGLATFRTYVDFRRGVSDHQNPYFPYSQCRTQKYIFKSFLSFILVFYNTHFCTYYVIFLWRLLFEGYERVKLILKPFLYNTDLFLKIYYLLHIINCFIFFNVFPCVKGINDYESEDEGLGLFSTNHIHSIKFF